MRARATQRGFTLLEVMIALAVLAIGLTYVLTSSYQTLRRADETRMVSVASELARGKMHDVEELLRKDGFQETDQSVSGTFDEEGWPTVEWVAEVRKVELPSPEQVQAMAQAQAQAQAQAAEQQAAQLAGGAGLGTGTGVGTGTGAEPIVSDGGGLFGMLSMLGGPVGTEDVAGAGFMSGGGYAIVQDIFKQALRKVVLTVKWKSLGRDQQMVVVQYLSDPDAMVRVLGAIGGATSGDYGQEGGDAPTVPRTPTPSPTPNPKSPK